MNIEAWRKNENTGSFDQLTKGTMLTIEATLSLKSGPIRSVWSTIVLLWCCQVLSSYRKGGCSWKAGKAREKRQKIILALSWTKRSFGRFCFAHDRINTHHTFISDCCDAKLQMKSSPGNTVILSSTWWTGRLRFSIEKEDSLNSIPLSSFPVPLITIFLPKSEVTSAVH